MPEIQRNKSVTATDVDEDQKTWWRRWISGQVWQCCLMGCVLGSIICGIALATIVVIFVQDSKRVTALKTNASTTYSSATTSITSTSTTPTLPYQCYVYTSITDASRLITAPGGTACDSASFSSTAQWIRFAGPGGTKIPDSAPSYYTCGTYYPGWYAGVYPSVASTTNTGAVCFCTSNSTTCTWNVSIQVTNCGPYYVFGLVNPPGCYMRYCTV